MGENTKIAWATDTYNPWWGCVEVSPACDICYAKIFDHRLGRDDWGKDAPRRMFGDKHWAEPLKWNQKAREKGEARRVFCGSMCDIGEDRPDLVAPRGRLIQLIYDTLWLDWLLLTKRPQNFPRLFPGSWEEAPPPNVWKMTTLENMDYAWRVDELVKSPAIVHGVSVEPMLGPVSIRQWGRWIQWVIIGGESGPGCREMRREWVDPLIAECREFGIACFVKQLGGHPDKRDKPEFWPEELRLHEVPMGASAGMRQLEVTRAAPAS